MAQDLSVQAIRTYVRSFIDVDSTDIPDALADAWMYAAWDDLMAVTNRWPFYEVGENANGTPNVGSNPGLPYFITTVVGTQEYLLPTVDSGFNPGVPASVNPHNMVAIQGPHWELLYGSITELESVYTPAFIMSAEPERWTFWGSTGISLWPIPNQTYQVNIRAYRSPIDWIGLGSGGLVDAPSDFFSAIQFFCLSQGWAQQTDLQQASFWQDQYQQAKGRLLRKYIQAPFAEGLVLNGGTTTRELPPRLRYPFEGTSAIGLFR